MEDAKHQQLLQLARPLYQPALFLGCNPRYFQPEKDLFLLLQIQKYVFCSTRPSTRNQWFCGSVWVPIETPKLKGFGSVRVPILCWRLPLSTILSIATMMFRLHSSHLIWQRQISLWNWNIIHTIDSPLTMGCTSYLVNKATKSSFSVGDLQKRPSFAGFICGSCPVPRGCF